MDLKDKINILPSLPGVYRFLDSTGTIIYIGKAKNLKKRVSQYFTNTNNLTTKTKVLVSKINDIEHTIVESEQDALLLENNLIKQYQPKYNILLKDGKSYPWITIKNEPFPRVFLTRRFIKDGSLYFGPYSSVNHAHHLLDLINTLYKLRNCKLALNSTDISNNKFKPCLNYHIKRCLAPCINNISADGYNLQIQNIKELLKGNTSTLIRDYKVKMKEEACNLEFEQAQIYKEQIEVLTNHYSKSLIVHPSITNTDVFSIVFEKDNAFGAFFRLNMGCIIQALNLHFKLNIEEPKESILTRFIQEIYNIVDSNNSHKTEEILVPFLPDNLSLGKNIHIPIRGDKLNLLDLCTKNATAYKFQKLKQEDNKQGTKGENRALLAIKEALNMSHLPLHIECFDNSNTQGTNPVASCVVFKNGKPSKKDYRHFNIKSVVGANDFASMYEVVTRRYSRLVNEGEPLPQLVLIDGGKGQLRFAYNALVDLHLEEQITIVGIAKRLEEIITINDSNSLFLDKNSPALKVLMQLRDEAHRFGITHHRGKRSKAQLNSQLTQIKGVGPKSQEKLLTHFKSVKRIKEASIEDLTAVVGKNIALQIKRELI